MMNYPKHERAFLKHNHVLIKPNCAFLERDCASHNFLLVLLIFNNFLLQDTMATKRATLGPL